MAQVNFFGGTPDYGRQYKVRKLREQLKRLEAQNKGKPAQMEKTVRSKAARMQKDMADAVTPASMYTVTPGAEPEVFQGPRMPMGPEREWQGPERPAGLGKRKRGISDIQMDDNVPYVPAKRSAPAPADDTPPALTQRRSRYVEPIRASVDDTLTSPDPPPALPKRKKSFWQKAKPIIERSMYALQGFGQGGLPGGVMNAINYPRDRRDALMAREFRNAMIPLEFEQKQGQVNYMNELASESRVRQAAARRGMEGNPMGAAKTAADIQATLAKAGLDTASADTKRFDLDLARQLAGTTVEGKNLQNQLLSGQVEGQSIGNQAATQALGEARRGEDARVEGLALGNEATALASNQSSLKQYYAQRVMQMYQQWESLTAQGRHEEASQLLESIKAANEAAARIFGPNIQYMPGFGSLSNIESMLLRGAAGGGQQ